MPIHRRPPDQQAMRDFRQGLTLDENPFPPDSAAAHIWHAQMVHYLN